MSSLNFFKTYQHWFNLLILLYVVYLIWVVVYNNDPWYKSELKQSFSPFSSAALERTARQGFSPFSSAALESTARQGFSPFSSAALERTARQGFIPEHLLSPYKKKEGFNSDILEKTAFDVPISSAELNPYNDYKTVTSNMLLQKALN
jgi:hypothetical protein